MHEKRVPLIDEETKHKKKSKSKGQPRSKHKHIYETVLLTKNYHTTNFKTGRPNVVQTMLPTKVCTVCGRIDRFDDDPSYYAEEPVSNIPFLSSKKVLSEKALGLPKWYVKDFWDKFSIKEQSYER